MDHVKTFRFRLEPNATQRQLFARFAGSCRFVYNWGLAAREQAHQAQKALTYAEQCGALPAMKKATETAWLKEVNAQVLQQALMDLDRAYQQAFRRIDAGAEPGFPGFKKKGQRDSFRYPQGIRLSEGRVFLPKIGWVRYRDSRPVVGRIRQATIKREGAHWFVCLVCDVEVASKVPVPTDDTRIIGIDVGLKNFAVLSDGTEIENPRFLKTALAKLRKAQRRLRRKTKRSRSWERQMTKVIKLHIKVKNSRKDFAHKVSSAIVKNHDVIAVEDLNILGMVKHRTLSRAIADAGWGQFLTMLTYKATWSGKHLVRIDRFLPTSQVCSACGAKKAMPLAVRTYRCDECGLELDRDWNASLNIRSAGLAVLNACGGA